MRDIKLGGLTYLGTVRRRLDFTNMPDISAEELSAMLSAPISDAAKESVRRGVQMARELSRTGRIVIREG